MEKGFRPVLQITITKAIDIVTPIHLSVNQVTKKMGSK